MNKIDRNTIPENERQYNLDYYMCETFMNGISVRKKDECFFKHWEFKKNDVNSMVTLCTYHQTNNGVFMYNVLLQAAKENNVSFEYFE